MSLAAALAVPATLADGAPFPARDLIIVVTFAEHEERLRHLDVEQRTEAESGPDGETDELDEYERLLAALLDDKRAAVVALRDEGTIDDIVLIRVQRGLDAEEIRLDRRGGADE